MSTYLTNIPQPNDDLDVSQGDLLGNFQAIDAWGLVNHYTFSDGTVNFGKHKNIQTPVQSPMPSTSANEPALFAYQFSSNSGVIQVSRGPSDTVPTPITSLQSSASPIVIAGGGGFINVLNFMGLSLAYGNIYSYNAAAGGGARTIYAFFWNGTTLLVSQILGTSSYTAQVSGTTLILKNDAVSPLNEIYWTLEFKRIA